MKTMRVFIMTFVLLLTGCISTEVNDFTDPDYTNFRVNKLLLVTPNKAFDEFFTAELLSKNLSTEIVTYSQLFLPTRTYSEGDIHRLLMVNKFDAILSITIKGEQAKTKIISYTTNTNAKIDSTGFGSAKATVKSTTTPITKSTRSTSSKAELFDPKKAKKIWVADLQTNASGAIYVQSDDTIESICKEVISSLIIKQHIGI